MTDSSLRLLPAIAGAGEIIDALVKAISTRAATGLLHPDTVGLRKEHGVQVLFNRKEPQLVRFGFVTHDRVAVKAIFNFDHLNLKGRAYFVEFVATIDQAIENKRAERHGKRILTPERPDPMREAVRKKMGEAGMDPDPIIEQVDRWADEFDDEEKLA